VRNSRPSAGSRQPGDHRRSDRLDRTPLWLLAAGTRDIRPRNPRHASRRRGAGAPRRADPQRQRRTRTTLRVRRRRAGRKSDRRFHPRLRTDRKSASWCATTARWRHFEAG
jgi:hypothetical protein